VAAIPAWTWHQVTAGEQELVLLKVTDRPVHEALGLYRSETAPGIAPDRGHAPTAPTQLPLIC
jgi:gentisate 1,2-dioxygenase